VIPLAAALAARGHSVRVVVPAWDSRVDWGRRLRVRGVEIIHLPSAPIPCPEFSPLLLAQIWRAAMRFDPDVLHCFKPIGYSGAVALGATRPGRPRRPLVVVDGDDLEGWSGWARRSGRSLWQAVLLSWQERQVLRSADVVTVASKYLLRLVRRWRGPKGHTHYLPNGVVTAPGHLEVSCCHSGEALRLLLYTRFNEFGLARGAAVLGRVMDEVPGAQVIVVGDGAERRAFQALIRAQAWGDRVSFRGFQTGDDLARSVAEANMALWLFDDNAVNRARSPVKLLELLASGKPVVAEDVGEVSALGAGGLRLTTPGDADAFAEAVRELANDLAERERLARHLRQTGQERLDWQRRAASLDRLYQLYT